MFEEDFPTKGPKASTETHLQWFLVGLTVFLSWVVGGNVGWALGIATALCLAGPFIFITHHTQGYFDFPAQGRRYLLYLLPVWVSIPIFVMGVFNPAVGTIEFSTRSFLILRETSPWLPTLTDWQIAWAPLLWNALLLAGVLPLLIIVESRWVLRNILIILGLNAAVLAVIGLLQYASGIERVLLAMQPPNPEFFATFIHPDHWGAFGLLWGGVLLGLACYEKFGISWRKFARGAGMLFLIAGAVVSFTVFLVGSNLAVFCMAIIVVVASWAFAEDAFKAGRGFLERACLPIVFLLVALGIGGLGSSLLYLEMQEQPSVMLKVDVEIDPTASEPVILRPVAGPNGKMERMEAALALFQEKPLFGWGAGGFGQAFAFYQNVELSDRVFLLAGSDALQALAERGFIGTLFWIFPACAALLTLLRSKEIQRWLTWFLLGTSCSALALALFESPFASPAVLVSFWIVFLSAIRWTTILTPVPISKRAPEVVFTEQELAAGKDFARQRSKPENTDSTAD